MNSLDIRSVRTVCRLYRATFGAAQPSPAGWTSVQVFITRGKTSEEKSPIKLFAVAGYPFLQSFLADATCRYQFLLGFKLEKPTRLVDGQE